MLTICLLSVTIYSLTELSNNDLLVTSEMAKVYIFTRDKSLFTRPHEQKALDEELSTSTLNMSDLRDIKVIELPTKTLLLKFK